MAKRCKYGKLKSPKGRRVCRKRRGRALRKAAAPKRARKAKRKSLPLVAVLGGAAVIGAAVLAIAKKET